MPTAYHDGPHALSAVLGRPANWDELMVELL